MLAHSVVAAVSDRRRRSEIDATIRARRERRYGQCAGTLVVGLDAILSSAFKVTGTSARTRLVDFAPPPNLTDDQLAQAVFWPCRESTSGFSFTRSG